MTIHPTFSNKTISAICAGNSPDDKLYFETWTQKAARVVKLNQQHTTNTVIWKTDNDLPDVSQPADALFTDQPNQALLLVTADCVPILIAHKTNHPEKPQLIIGAVHAGRRGTEQRILAKSLSILLSEWGAGTTQLWFGPHICSQCYEIDRTTHQTFDLQSELLHQVESILPAGSFQITTSEHCTVTDTNWYSYRREGEKALRNLTGICIWE